MCSKASRYQRILLGISLLISATVAYVPVPFNTTNRYGVDGPWQAVTVNVGGFENGTLDSAQWTTVDMMPGSYWETYVLRNSLCASDSSNICGSGGLWKPGEQEGDGYVGTTIFFRPEIEEPASQIHASGEVYSQNMNVETPGQSETTPTSSLVAVDKCNRTLPNGDQIECETGLFSLGADEQQQMFSTGVDAAEYAYMASWTMPGYLYNTSSTKSYSYTMHIGSTRYAYAGSLIFGGYDKGRGIGPATSWGDSPPQLLDITIGVEVGGSPFDFTEKRGLLLDETSTQTQLPVLPNGLQPYIHLPKTTCDELAKYLPVEHDNKSGYYLWDLAAPSYNDITTSAAYLGFVFPPSTGGIDNVVIKVPFQLLVLNLTQEASGRPGLTPYFPCMPFTPPGGKPDQEGVDGNTESYLLGRAFLQAALFGRNWNQHVSWLAQAPGPGPSRQGMGYQPLDIEDDDTTLVLYEGEDYFRDSWSDYWTPLPEKTVGGETSSSTSSSQPDDTQLSLGAKVGIGIGAAAVALTVFGIIVWICIRRRSNNEQVTEQNASAEYFEKSTSDNAGQNPHPWIIAHEMLGEEGGLTELAQVPRSPRELHGRARFSNRRAFGAQTRLTGPVELDGG